mmetsp:Transcript_22595/g.46875  ORF Transcript_22595/g.46875 Transcript_22595/m.46875 type:complete len:547 (-) Transcript_22595:413-2053(-)
MKASVMIQAVIATILVFSSSVVPVLALAPTPAPATILTTVEPSMGLVEEISRTQLSGSINASPRCWTVAINALSEFMHVGTLSSSEFCAAMTQLQQDVLALELARCHMEKSRTPFIIDGDTVSAEDCSGKNLVDQVQVDACLAHLDTNSYNVYVQLTMHVQQLCVRFTDELVTARQEQAALLLAQSSHVVSQQLTDLMTRNDELINKVMEQQELLGNQSVKMKEFNDAIENMREDISATTDHIQPFESIVRRMTQGFSWFASFLHFLVALNVSWILTMSKRSRRARSALVNLVLLEALLEILSHWAVYNDYLQKEDQENAVALWRKTFMVVELCTYVVGTVLSFFFSQSGGEDDESNAIAAMKKSQAQLLHHVSRESEEARRQMAEQTEQMVEMWRKRQDLLAAASSSPHPDFFVGAHRRGPGILSPNEGRRYSLPPQVHQLSLARSVPSREVPSDLLPHQRSNSVLPPLNCAAPPADKTNGNTSSRGQREVTPDSRKRKRNLEPSTDSDTGRQSSRSSAESVLSSADEDDNKSSANGNKKRRAGE